MYEKRLRVSLEDEARKHGVDVELVWQAVRDEQANASYQWSVEHENRAFERVLNLIVHGRPAITEVHS